MAEDYARASFTNTHMVMNTLLLTLRRLLHTYKKNISDYNLPLISDDFVSNSQLPRIIEDELSVHIPEEDLQYVARLNYHQKVAFDAIVHAILHNQSRIFFIDGPGGSGKTFLYRALLAHLRQSGHIVIATTTSGIAATLLPGGRTAHSRLKILIKPRSGSYCKIHKQTELAELIKRATTIIWDEAPMANRYSFESVNRTFKDIMDNDVPFGGKIMIMGGDFRQELPVVRGGSIGEQIAASVSRSTIWDGVHIIRLQQNMRSQSDVEFSEFVLRIGNGQEQAINGDFIKLPPSMVIPWESEQSIYDLIDAIFPNMVDHANDANYMVGRAIISPRNVDVDNINEMMIGIFPGEEKVYTSWDSVDDDNNNLFSDEFLNSLNPSGLPPHRIVLKRGSPIMLLRNVAPELGLCNGTRLICRNLARNFIDAEIMTGPHKGTRYFLHRMPLKTEENSGLPFVMTCAQFPIRLSFALTINKSQGQTIPNVGIYLRNHVFSHGQLYVALSRRVSQQTTKILVKNWKQERRSGIYTRNVVYRDVLLPSDQ